MKKVFLFIFSFIFFSFGIFILKNYFFGGLDDEINKHIEENYIEPTIIEEEIILDDISLDEENKDSIRVALKSAYKINFIYFPKTFSASVLAYTNSFKLFLNNEAIKNKIDNLKVELYEEKGEVRGKMKYHRVKLFGVKKMSISEYLAVGIHEFAHFVDLYFLEKKVFTDISNFYYNISWESTKVMKGGLVQADFVSGYAMTNKYEDFAESFTYFILHNADFLEKSKKSKLLKSKYDFFTKYLFRDEKFNLTDHSEGNIIKSYYRDITKIDFSLKKFLIFLKN